MTVNVILKVGYEPTYPLRLCFILCRIELPRLLCMVWYRPLTLPKFLRLVLSFAGTFRRRHHGAPSKGKCNAPG